MEVTGSTDMPCSSIRKGYHRRRAWCRAVFDDSMRRGDLFRDAVVEKNDAIGDVFLQAVARKRSFPFFRCDDRGEPFSLSQRKDAGFLREEFQDC